MGGSLLELLLLRVYLADAGEFADFLVDVVQNLFLEVLQLLLSSAFQLVSGLEKGLELIGIEMNQGCR